MPQEPTPLNYFRHLSDSPEAITLSPIMSATIIPWRPRTSVTLPKTTVYLPALIDGHVTVRALIEGLASAGLLLQYDPATGKLLIHARQEGPEERSDR
jgi:hypothetical protein